MNRRELLKLFGSTPLAPMLPMVKSVEVVRVTPNDTIVIKSEQRLSREDASRIMETAEKLFKGNKIVVLDRGLDIHASCDGPNKRKGRKRANAPGPYESTR